MKAPLCPECGVEVKTDPHKCPKPQREFVARIMLIGLEPFTTQAAVLQAASPLWQHYEDHAAARAELEEAKAKAFHDGWEASRKDHVETTIADRDALQAKLDSTQSAATSWEESARKYHDDYLEVREISHKRMVEINALQAKLAEAERELEALREYADGALEPGATVEGFGSTLAALEHEMDSLLGAAEWQKGRADAAEALLEEFVEWGEKSLASGYALAVWFRTQIEKVSAHLASPAPESPRVDDSGVTDQSLTTARDELRRTTDAIQADVGDLLVACGLGNHARPDSCHNVIQWEILPRIRAMASQCAWVWDDEAQTAQGCDDA